AHLALPDRASRPLGLRSSNVSKASDGAQQRPQRGRCRSTDQAWFFVRLQSANRSAVVARRGASGAPVRCAWRILVADAAVPYGAAAVRETIIHGKGRQSIPHTRATGSGTPAIERLSERRAIHTAQPSRNNRTARSQRRRELG